MEEKNRNFFMAEILDEAIFLFKAKQSHESVRT
jgi:hypothetical protein